MTSRFILIILFTFISSFYFCDGQSSPIVYNGNGYYILIVDPVTVYLASGVYDGQLPNDSTPYLQWQLTYLTQRSAVYELADPENVMELLCLQPGTFSNASQLLQQVSPLANGHPWGELYSYIPFGRLLWTNNTVESYLIAPGVSAWQIQFFGFDPFSNFTFNISYSLPNETYTYYPNNDTSLSRGNLLTWRYIKDQLKATVSMSNFPRIFNDSQVWGTFIGLAANISFPILPGSSLHFGSDTQTLECTLTNADGNGIGISLDAAFIIDNMPFLAWSGIPLNSTFLMPTLPIPTSWTTQLTTSFCTNITWDTLIWDPTFFTIFPNPLESNINGQPLTPKQKQDNLAVAIAVPISIGIIILVVVVFALLSWMNPAFRNFIRPFEHRNNQRPDGRLVDDDDRENSKGKWKSAEATDKSFQQQR